MSAKVLSFFRNARLLSGSQVTPRRLNGPVRILVSVLCVVFSYFFIHVAFFGQPTTPIFKGAYMGGTAVLCFLLFRGRRQPLQEGFSLLNEIFSFLALAAMGALYGVIVFWTLTSGPPIWRDFIGFGMEMAAAVGALIGVLIYGWEATRRDTKSGFSISDCFFLLSTVMAISWWVYNQGLLLSRLGSAPFTWLVIFAGLFIVVSFEIARRVMGPAIPIIGIVFLVYTYAPIAQRFPSALRHPGFPMDRISEYLFLAAGGMTGFLVDVFATYVVIFIVLGAFLEKTGVGSIFVDTTFRLTGQRTGGPGLTAVAASGLFGMISGSGVANVITTGTFTIPLMKRVGYKPEFAAAVEAAASTGGGYMPPIMGAGAFLLAQFTETSYLEVIKIAAIPAILYFLSVGYMVYTRAKRRGLLGIPVAELPTWAAVVPRLYLLLPIPAMVYYLMIGDSAFLAAFKTILLIVILKELDLLSQIRTPWSDRLGKPFLAVALLAGAFAYFFGLQVGPPFTWFTPSYRGVNLGDVLFWSLGTYFLLKLGEFLWAGLQVPALGADAAREGEILAGPAVFSRVRESFWELVKVSWASLESGAANTLVVGCLTGVLGIILSSATQSALPGRVSELLTELSFDLLPLTLFWIILLGYVVGMGLPIPAAYVILIIFGVVSLTNLGVPTLTAHLICYWVAVVSAVTPPVAIAAYAASGIAMSDPIKTSFQALKLASWIFIMPFLFAYTPLLLTGTWVEILITVVACLFGIVAWSGMLEKFLLHTTNRAEWVLLLAASVCLLLPIGSLVAFLTPLEGGFLYPAYAAGVILLGFAFFLQKKRSPALA